MNRGMFMPVVIGGPGSRTGAAGSRSRRDAA
jgi:hypothetical protein